MSQESPVTQSPLQDILQSTSEEEGKKPSSKESREIRKRHRAECHRTVDHEAYHAAGKKDHVSVCPGVCTDTSCPYDEGHYVRTGLQKTGKFGKKIKQMGDEEKEALINERKRKLNNGSEPNPKKQKKEEKKKEAEATKIEKIKSDFQAMLDEARTVSNAPKPIVIEEDSGLQAIASIGDKQQQHALTMVAAAANIQHSFKHASIVQSKREITIELESLKRTMQRGVLTIEEILAQISK